MATPDQAWKRGDTLPGVEWTLQLPPGMTLVNATEVKQHMKHKTTNAVVTRIITISNAAQNKILYQPITGDLDVTGDYNVEFEVKEPGGGVYTVPNKEVVTNDGLPYYLYRVFQDLA